jgi:hypothetical protein
MLNIKDPVLVSKTVNATWIVDVDGTKIEVVYWYNLDDEQSGGWDYDLTPCYENLTEEEIENLEEEFEMVIEDLGV